MRYSLGIKNVTGTRVHRGLQVVQAGFIDCAHPEVDSRRGRSSQGPNPPTFPDLTQVGIMVVHLIYDHNGHIYLRMCVIIKMCQHGRNFSPPVCDVKTMIVDSVMKGLPHFTHILLATPPACD